VLSGFWREPIAKAPLEPLREAEAERTVTRTRDQWLANMLSVSSIASLPDADREALCRAAPRARSDVEYRWSIRTIAYWARLSELAQLRQRRARRTDAFGRLLAAAPRPRQEALELDADALSLDSAPARDAARGALTALSPTSSRSSRTSGCARCWHGARAGSAERRSRSRTPTVDAVFVGERSTGSTAASGREIDRVLRPRGGLAIFWTHWWETEPRCLSARWSCSVSHTSASRPSASRPGTTGLPTLPSSRCASSGTRRRWSWS
jgi:hypothetical protein